METKELKVYAIDFRPIVNGIIKASRTVLFIAYSEKQAKKFFFDWRHNVRKHPCVLEMIYERTRDKETHIDDWRTELQKHFEEQQNLIYRGGKENVKEKEDN